LAADATVPAAPAARRNDRRLHFVDLIKNLLDLSGVHFDDHIISKRKKKASAWFLWLISGISDFDLISPQNHTRATLSTQAQVTVVALTISNCKKLLSYEPKEANALFNLGAVKQKGKNDPAGAIADGQQLLPTNLNQEAHAQVEKLIAQAEKSRGETTVVFCILRGVH
jgi:hypothetical protein